MTAEQKYCPNCGTPSPINVVFCLSCGSKFPEIGQPGSTTRPPTTSIPSTQATASPSLLTLSCPSCGGRLQITEDVERFACQFCGHEHIVRRNDGIVSLEPVLKVIKNINSNIGFVGEQIHKVGFNSEKQAAEQSIVRLKSEIAELEKTVGARESNWQNLMTIGIILSGMGGASIVAALILKWSIIVMLFALPCLIIGIIIMVSPPKDSPEVTAKHQQLREKIAELQKNKRIVNSRDLGPYVDPDRNL